MALDRAYAGPMGEVYEGMLTMTIDLSRFGKGTYILRITDPHGQRNERVVVE